MSKLRVIIVDDHPLMRRGLRETLEADECIEVCGEAEDVGPALELLRTAKPAVALVDISLPGGSGLELAKQMLALDSGLKILFVSIHDDAVFAERAVRAGALGYINKSQAGTELLEAVHKVARGALALSAPVAERLMRRGLHPHSAPASDMEALSDRELEVFELIGRGLSTRDIAERLSLSIKTVETHREHIKRKLGLGSAVELSHRATLWTSNQG